MDESIARNLIHSPELFEKASFEARKEELNINNIVRMELFLWDLELFLQIQHLHGDSIVLKGGAAVQFYLPVENQRTSVDIDMIFSGKEEEIYKTLDFISHKFGCKNGLLVFTPFVPKNPKTKLPLRTFMIDIPSVFDERVLRSGGCTKNPDHGGRPLKTEFFLRPGVLNINKLSGRNIFAGSSDKIYNVLPINQLFADKLTTLGPETIGIQNSRIDEQAKQLYDLCMLLNCNLSNISLKEVKEYYWKYAEMECKDREITFSTDRIIADVKSQLSRIKRIDISNDEELKQKINDFKGLYLNRASNFSVPMAAIAGEQLSLLYDCLLTEKFDLIKQLFVLAEQCKLHSYSGPARGDKERQIKEGIIKYFNATEIPDKILKGKSLIRVFWCVVSLENLFQIRDFLNDELEV